MAKVLHLKSSAASIWAATMMAVLAPSVARADDHPDFGFSQSGEIAPGTRQETGSLDLFTPTSTGFLRMDSAELGRPNSLSLYGEASLGFRSVRIGDPFAGFDPRTGAPESTEGTLGVPSGLVGVEVRMGTRVSLSLQASFPAGDVAPQWQFTPGLTSRGRGNWRSVFDGYRETHGVGRAKVTLGSARGHVIAIALTAALVPDRANHPLGDHILIRPELIASRTEGRWRHGISVWVGGGRTIYGGIKFSPDQPGQPIYYESAAAFGLTGVGGALGYDAAPWLELLGEARGEFVFGRDLNPALALAPMIGIRAHAANDVSVRLTAGTTWEPGNVAYLRSDLSLLFNIWIPKPHIAVSPDPRDRDLDGIDDAHDRCPDSPGTESIDGCPSAEPTPSPPENRPPHLDGEARLTQGQIAIAHEFAFETNSATLQENSTALLTEVATLLQAHSEITLLEIAGHTDERAGATYNKDLSERRAAAVREALVSRGIDGARLRAIGFGASCAIADGHDEQAWKRNRRVRLLVRATSDGSPTVHDRCM